MAYDRLALYNEALRLCGERRIVSLTEAREPRYLLDDVWNGRGVDDALEAGQWKFAMKAVMLDHDPDEDPSFGYRFAFSKPTDYIRTAGVCSDEFFKSPLLQYQDETNFIYADVDPIYVRYVSNAADYGANMSNWPGTFCLFAASYFATQIIYKLTGDKQRIALVEGKANQALKDALNKDAMKAPTTFPAPGSWVKARFGNTTRRDGGSRGNLIG